MTSKTKTDGDNPRSDVRRNRPASPETTDDEERQRRFESLEYLLEYAFKREASHRIPFLLNNLIERLREDGISAPSMVTTPYVNTIPVEQEPPYPRDRAIERRIKSYARWNAMAMVVKANRIHHGIGGHISTYASWATRYEVSFNSSLDEGAEEIIYKDYYHIGVAVDTEAGLIVPVIKDVDKKGMLSLSQELTASTQRARERKVSLDDLQGGTFTISNQGSIGGGHFTPIVYKPQVAILGLGRSAVRPVVKKEGVGMGTVLPLCLS